MKNRELKSVHFSDSVNAKTANINSRSRLVNYEKIRVVGKGAFGTAILYNRKQDNENVIIKQVDMILLSAAERQMALNEAKVLSTLNHPNIIKHYDSFEEDGVLYIEMEYADGGNLEEYLAKLNNPMDEIVVLNYFHQIIAAIEHMHDRRILHRDLKTANIFMTQEGAIKVGDFGISKKTSTARRDASTIVGTPYYISPEMCEGKHYDEKSDIWALGCVLYEMICLHRTFEATNFPALVQKITKGQFTPIGNHYSADFRQLVGDILQQDPMLRPAAKEILRNKLPQLIKQRESGLILSTASLSQSRRTRSVLYSVKFFQDNLDLFPLETPSRLSIQQVAASSTHVLFITSEMQVYGFGDNSKGQLGFEGISYVYKPISINSIRQTSVTRVGAGDGFSIFVCSNGLVMSCGSGEKGCLGHGDWKDTSRPRIIEKLISVDITAVACGSSHVVVIAGGKWAFSWGCGLHGRLGHGKEENICAPMEILFPENMENIRNVRCSFDGTILLTSTGCAWAFGNNANNKLGLNTTISHLSVWRKENTIKQAMQPTRIIQLSRPALDVSLGSNHSAFLLDNGQIITCGLNTHGQLGYGHRTTENIAKLVTAMKDTPVNILSCCDTYTLAGTVDNVLYVWGERKVMKIDIEWKEHSSVNLKTNLDAEKAIDIDDYIQTLRPQEILILFSSVSQVKRGETLVMAGIFNCGPEVFLIVNTTISPPHRPHCLQVTTKITETPALKHPINVSNNGFADKRI